MLHAMLFLMAIAATFSIGVLIGDRRRDMTEAAGSTSEDEAGKERRRRAKRHNERLKLISAFSNGLGIAFVATSVLAPIATRKEIAPRDALLAVGLALILHFVGQYFVTFWKSEE